MPDVRTPAGLPVVLAAAAAAMLFLGGGVLLTTADDATVSASSAQQSVTLGTSPSVKQVPPAPAVVAPPVHVGAAAPEQITVRSVGIDAQVAPYTDADVAENDGWIEPPTSDAASWWAGGGTPATDADNTVYLYGHVSRDPAAFNALHDVQPGALVEVCTAYGTLCYTVTEVLEPIPKESLPDDERVKDAVPGRLVLIGCHRDDDQGLRPTTHNTVVIAQLTAAQTVAA